MQNKNKGFTLIELLVVIAIIGILAAVVLASLNTARNRGADAAIKANLVNTGAQAQLYYETNNAYSSTNLTANFESNCARAASIFDAAATNNITAGVSAAVTASGAAATCVLGTTTGQKASAWAVWVPLKATTGTYWCVDSTGASKQEAAAVTTQANCQ